MTRTCPLLNHSLLAILTFGALLLAVPSGAWAQHSRSGGGSSGHSSSGGGSGSATGGSSGGDHSRPSGTTSGGQAVPRGASGSSAPTGTSGSGNAATGAVTKEGSRDSSGTASTDASGARSRDGRTVIGHAVARPPNSNGGTVVLVPGYYPWAYGGIGLGGYYGFYDPGWYDPYPPVYTSGGGYGYEGALRLKVKPREASVYVDGYFAGLVNDFDGVFQRLKLDAGPHRVEIRLDGYETLTFDVRIDPDRTTTYTGELKKVL